MRYYGTAQVSLKSQNVGSHLLRLQSNTEHHPSAPEY